MSNEWVQIKTWEPLSKIEDASLDEVLKRLDIVKEIQMPHMPINTIPYRYNTKQKVTYSTNELVALCPVTFLPDYHHLRITYIPKKVVPELKALKFYLVDYMQLPISHEMLATKIWHDFSTCVNPEKCQVKLYVKVRGGIETKVEVGDEL
jgi:7-cyano-7-deazaguanine reductase